MIEAIKKLTERVCKRSEECTTKIISARNKKMNFCRRTNRRSFGEDYSFPLNYERWIGSTAKRYTCKKKLKLARLQTILKEL